MSKIKKGDIVGRISYGKDILFYVDKIIKVRNAEELVILKGVTIRIEADSPIYDLEVIDKSNVNRNINGIEQKLEKKIKKNILPMQEKKNGKRGELSGKILHLDGDKRYSEKALKYYKKMKLNAVVQNVPEKKQPLMINGLLKKYNPEVLIITGHDGMIKNGTDYNDINNYRNSRYFIETVLNARRWKESGNELVIFARSLSKFF